MIYSITMASQIFAPQYKFYDINHRHVFGINENIRNNVAFSDDQTIVYPCGQLLILTSTESRQQKFVPAEVGSCMAVNQELKLACISTEEEETEDQEATFVLHLIDLQETRKRKPLADSSVKGSCVSIGFSYDGKYLVAQASAPESGLYIWLVEKVYLCLILSHGYYPR